MKRTVMQIFVVIEENEQPQPARRPQVPPFIEFVNWLYGETTHGRIPQQPEWEDKEHGPHVPQ